MKRVGLWRDLRRAAAGPDDRDLVGPGADPGRGVAPPRGPAGRTGYHRRLMDAIRGALAALLIGIAATLVIVALAILPFLTPAWVAFGQAQAEAAAWTGYTTDDLRTVTDAILADLVVGPPDFDVTLNGAAVLDEGERQHMRDVRGVFAAFYAAALAGAAILVAAFLLARGPERRARLWRRLSRTGVVGSVVTVVGRTPRVATFG